MHAAGREKSKLLGVDQLHEDIGMARGRPTRNNEPKVTLSPDDRGRPQGAHVLMSRLKNRAGRYEGVDTACVTGVTWVNAGQAGVSVNLRLRYGRKLRRRHTRIGRSS